MTGTPRTGRCSPAWCADTKRVGAVRAPGLASSADSAVNRPRNGSVDLVWGVLPILQTCRRLGRLLVSRSFRTGDIGKAFIRGLIVMPSRLDRHTSAVVMPGRTPRPLRPWAVLSQLWIIWPVTQNSAVGGVLPMLASDVGHSDALLCPSLPDRTGRRAHPRRNSASEIERRTAEAREQAAHIRTEPPATDRPTPARRVLWLDLPPCSLCGQSHPLAHHSSSAVVLAAVSLPIAVRCRRRCHGF